MGGGINATVRTADTRLVLDNLRFGGASDRTIARLGLVVGRSGMRHRV